jgi:glucosamine-6-phosphate deaminase
MAESILSSPSRLRVVIAPDADGAVEEALLPLRLLLRDETSPRIGLATGRTFQTFFRRVLEEARRGRLGFESASLTHLDEFAEIDPGAPGSMAHELADSLLDRLPAGPSSFLPVPAGASGEVGIRRYEESLRAWGPLHLQYLGLGRNGHVAFNEPGTHFGRGVHLCSLARATREDLAPRFAPAPVPRSAITAGPATILSAQELVLLATGAAKAPAVRRLLEDPVTEDLPAGLIRLHARALLVLDQDSARELGPRARKVPRAAPPLCAAAAELRPSGSVVVLAPHPDDAAISCGGLLASLPAGVPRTIVVMTEGSRAQVPGVPGPEAVARLREEEARLEARILGAGVEFLRGRFYESHAFESADARALLGRLRDLAPVWVFAPSALDPHPTHRLARLVADEAIPALASELGRPIEVWTCEGPWHQHRREDVNAVIHHAPEAEAVKLEAVRAHKSQVSRVPFDDAAAALARLRGATFSETHFGGREARGLAALPLVEAFVREIYEP